MSPSASNRSYSLLISWEGPNNSADFYVVQLNGTGIADTAFATSIEFGNLVPGEKYIPVIVAGNSQSGVGLPSEITNETFNGTCN